MEEEKTKRLKKTDEKERHCTKNDCREKLIASKTTTAHPHCSQSQKKHAA
jgi:hypothetical protein